VNPGVTQVSDIVVVPLLVHEAGQLEKQAFGFLIATGLFRRFGLLPEGMLHWCASRRASAGSVTRA
jgi:hypothetical protein